MMLPEGRGGEERGPALPHGTPGQLPGLGAPEGGKGAQLL